MNNIALYIMFFISSSIDGHLGYFRTVAIDFTVSRTIFFLV